MHSVGLFGGPAAARVNGEEPMSKIEDEGARIEAIAVLDAVEISIVGFDEIFREVATGVPLDRQRAETLAVQCEELLKIIVDTRNVIRLAARTKGVQ
jgi:hypothetical protein